MRRYKNAEMKMIINESRNRNLMLCDFCANLADFQINWSVFRHVNLCSSHYNDLTRFD